MKEIPTVKVIDPDFEGGFRIINESDMTPDDKPFVEKAAKEASKSTESAITSTEIAPTSTETPAPVAPATVAKAPRIRNRSKK